MFQKSGKSSRNRGLIIYKGGWVKPTPLNTGLVTCTGRVLGWKRTCHPFNRVTGRVLGWKRTCHPFNICTGRVLGWKRTCHPFNRVTGRVLGWKRTYHPFNRVTGRVLGWKRTCHPFNRFTGRVLGWKRTYHPFNRFVWKFEIKRCRSFLLERNDMYNYMINMRESFTKEFMQQSKTI
jgi:hypothetical protein